jgi:hypothetical protein
MAWQRALADGEVEDGRVCAEVRRAHLQDLGWSAAEVDEVFPQPARADL